MLWNKSKQAAHGICCLIPYGIHVYYITMLCGIPQVYKIFRSPVFPLATQKQFTSNIMQTLHSIFQPQSGRTNTCSRLLDMCYYCQSHSDNSAVYDSYVSWITWLFSAWRINEHSQLPWYIICFRFSSIMSMHLSNWLRGQLPKCILTYIPLHKLGTTVLLLSSSLCYK